MVSEPILILRNFLNRSVVCFSLAFVASCSVGAILGYIAVTWKVGGLSDFEVPQFFDTVVGGIIFGFLGLILYWIANIIPLIIYHASPQNFRRVYKRSYFVFTIFFGGSLGFFIGWAGQF